jgi:molecular chaperone GrpE (heat shock protein)
MSVAIDSLNRQMSTAMTAITELAVAQRGRGEAVVRTAPLDRATATFQRLIAEVMDEKLAELAPPLVSLRSEMAQRVRTDGHSDPVAAEFYQRGVEVLDQVLSLGDIRRYEVPVGAAFDSLIHLAVGETRRGDLPNGVVAESVQPGFRTARGKVIAPAKVKVNRR